MEQPSSEPDHCRETERKEDRGREGGRKSSERQAPEHLSTILPVRNKQAAVQIPAVQIPLSNRMAEQHGEGGRQGEKVIYVQGRESNTQEEGSGAFSPLLINCHAKKEKSD